ncbi:hypothetical protein ACFIOY_13410 [Bradyrhizobium sp. TZ2]
MPQDDDQTQSDAADQTEGAGGDLDTNNDTDTGADDVQDTGDETADGNDNAADEGGYKTKFEDQQKRANKAEDFLRKAGLDPKTGKPKESRAPKTDGKNVLSEEDTGRITKAEYRAERAALRSMGTPTRTTSRTFARLPKVWMLMSRRHPTTSLSKASSSA